VKGCHCGRRFLIRGQYSSYSGFCSGVENHLHQFDQAREQVDLGTQSRRDREEKKKGKLCRGKYARQEGINEHTLYQRRKEKTTEMGRGGRARRAAEGKRSVRLKQRGPSEQRVKGWTRAKPSVVGGRSQKKS